MLRKLRPVIFFAIRAKLSTLPYLGKLAITRNIPQTYGEVDYDNNYT